MGRDGIEDGRREARLRGACALPWLVLGVVAACAPMDREPSGRALYEARCASCHGATGRGDGPMADRLDRRPADLTALSTEWQGYPRVHVMSYVDGYYRRGERDEVMPVFGAEMADAPSVPFDAGDGERTPAPLPLVRLAEYVASLQRDAPPAHPEP